MNDLFIREGIMHTGHFGYADTRVTNAATTNKLLSRMLQADPALFSTNEPLA
ncbi:hypothetical protein [Paenibacillus glycinis]|uniref:Uncharacterized protein n=1 Tax=Paenibacillus glycinis TaxID=2697035 RepID=A0ABW9XQC0_9BACL|nr:hypothetical protein [Paenibacillus glycinis]NBD24820.1 hypothetical protein [Paenibacillus glycinis]